MSMNPLFHSVGVVQSAAKDLKKLKQATEKIEGMFLKDLLTEMRKTAQHKAFGDSTGSGIYEDLMDQTMAENLSKGGSLGMGKMLYKQFSREALQQAETRIRQAAQASKQMEATASKEQSLNK